MTTSDRIPLPMADVFQRLEFHPASGSAADVLSRVATPDTVLQEFRPVTQSLEWELSELYWNQAGLLPFVENHVPFLINNSGFLSEHISAVLFANCVETPPAGPIAILELGAGVGLFARYFLESFRAICKQEGRDFYDRLIYYVTDRSVQTVRQWRERDQFSVFEDHVKTGTVNATNPNLLYDVEGNVTELSALRAVICNYVLDVLPATVVRNASTGPEELRVRTHLVDDASVLAQYTSVGSAEIRRLSQSPDANDKARLTPLLSLLDFETQFFALGDTNQSSADRAMIAEALQSTEPNERVVLNYGAVTCLEHCLALLDEHGVILINDYGPVNATDVPGHSATQRFGPTSALGLNFPLLERHFTACGAVVVTPESDGARGIHARLLMKSRHAATFEAFENRFGPAGVDFFEAPCIDAKTHVLAGRKSEALDAYRVALSRTSRSWQLSGEIAEFVGLQLHDLAAGRELIRAAIELNPWYSAWLWNILGDILFLQKNVSGAHEAYLQAQTIDPRDGRTNLNLAYTHFETGAYEQALQALAVAFASDTLGLFRPRLLEKQQQVLAAISNRWQGEQERLARRAARMLR